MPTILKILLYPLFALFCLVLFSILLFPFDSLKNRVAQEMERGLGGRYSISIGKLSPSPLAGLVLHDLSIRSATASEGTPEAIGAKISRLKMKFGLIAMLRHALAIDFQLRAGAGKAKGSFALSSGETSLDADMKALDLAAIPFATDSLGVPMGGEVSGVIDLDLYPQDPLKNVGKVLLDLNRLELKETAFGGGAVSIPTVQLVGPAPEKSRIEASVSRGNWEIPTVRLLGGDIECDASGKIYGARSLDNYRFNLKGTLKISPALLEKVPILMAIEKQKNPDGTYPFTVTGRFSKPSIRIGDFKVPI